MSEMTVAPAMVSAKLPIELAGDAGDERGWDENGG